MFPSQLHGAIHDLMIWWVKIVQFLFQDISWRYSILSLGSHNSVGSSQRKNFYKGAILYHHPLQHGAIKALVIKKDLIDFPSEDEWPLPILVRASNLFSRSSPHRHMAAPRAYDIANSGVLVHSMARCWDAPGVGSFVEKGEVFCVKFRPINMLSNGKFERWTFEKCNVNFNHQIHFEVPKLGTSNSFTVKPLDLCKFDWGSFPQFFLGKHSQKPFETRPQQQDNFLWNAEMLSEKDTYKIIKSLYTPRKWTISRRKVVFQPSF